MKFEKFIQFFLTLLIMIFVTGAAFGETGPKWLTIDADAIDTAKKNLAGEITLIEVFGGVALIKTTSQVEMALSQIMHEKHHRCGGFISHDSEEEARKALHNHSIRSLAEKAIFADYNIDQQDIVSPLVERVDALRIESTILKLSSFHNRYYRANTGVQSQEWVKQKWAELGAGRSDVKVEKFEHRSWPQPSIIMTVKGESDEVIVVGGHADSISGWFGRNTARAPGADDNASGIATITEAIRILMEASYKPKKTIKFMAYAAEEVGLLGSKEIARDFKARGVNVVGVLQLDMTNFNGTNSQDITLISDYTNAAQNTFFGRLIDEYVHLPWGYDRCGYACSDHASWTGQGFAASMPFEARKNDMNRRIHTANDTFQQSGGTADHAAKFAKLTISYIVELDQ